MVVFNYSGEEINAKIVYYGPGLSGKTTNLEFIYSKMPTQVKGKMVSMKTRTDRTLFFDFLPLELGDINGYRTRFLLYTVPGQVYYNATRKLVLKGADAVVFVADSSQQKMNENIESLRNLEENLNEHNLTLDSIPWVIQYNKRDLPNAMPIPKLEEQLNLLAVPTFEAVATSGEGIYETFQGIARMLYSELKKRLEETETRKTARPANKAPVSTADETVSTEARLDQVLNQYSAPEATKPVMSAPASPGSPPAGRTMNSAQPAVGSPEREPALTPATGQPPMDDTVEIPGQGGAETEVVSDVIDMALREVDNSLGLIDPGSGSPLPAAPAVAEPPVTPPAQTTEPAGFNGPESASPVASSAPVATDVEPAQATRSPEPEPTHPDPPSDSDFSPMNEAELEDRLGRVVDLDESIEPEGQEKMNGDVFITDPCRLVVPDKEDDQALVRDEDDSTVIESKPATVLSSDELTVKVPVLISRSQVRRTIPLKLVLEIHVTDDESKS